MKDISRRTMMMGAAAAAVGLSLVTGAAAQEKVTLKVANFSAAGGHINDNVMLAWLDKVVAESEGTLAYKFFPGGVLGRNPSEQLKLVQDGIADMAFVIPDYTPGAFTKWGVVGIPNLAKSTEEASLALERAMEEGLIETPTGVKVLGVFSSAINHLHADTPYTSLDDVSGQRVRAVGKAQMEAIEKLGGTPISNLRATEVAEAVSRGTVDAASMDYLALESFRVEEAVNSHIDLPLGAVGLIYPMNQKTWDNLPAPAKAAFEANSGETFSRFAAEQMNEGAKAVRERLAEREGQTFLEITPEVEKDYAERLGAVQDAWIGGDAELQAVYDRFSEILQDIRNGN